MSRFEPNAEIFAAPAPAEPRAAPAPLPRAAAGPARARTLGYALAVLLLSRCAAEIVNTFAWNSTNYVWSACALVCLTAWMWPLLLALTRGEGNLLVEYAPILAYLAWLLVRVQIGNLNSVKCLLSEFIVWSSFVFAVEVCSRSPDIAAALRRLVVWIVKLIVLVGLGQMAVYVAQTGDFDPLRLVEARPVRGIFVHPNVFLVVMLPFLFYFVKQRSWVWTLLAALACLGTGTRSPLFAAACLGILVVRSAMRRPITWKHLTITLVITGAAYCALIRANFDDTTSEVDSRLSGASLQWRIGHWKDFWQHAQGREVLVGHGTGTADGVLDALYGENLLPHNDYVRVFYDSGLIGLLAYVGVILFMVRLLMRSSTVENDFVLLGYLVIVCFCITDNFIYFTLPMWIYVFFGSFVVRPGAWGGEPSGPDPLGRQRNCWPNEGSSG